MSPGFVFFFFFKYSTQPLHSSIVISTLLKLRNCWPVGLCFTLNFELVLIYLPLFSKKSFHTKQNKNSLNICLNSFILNDKFTYSESIKVDSFPLFHYWIEGELLQYQTGVSLFGHPLHKPCPLGITLPLGKLK